MLENRRIGSTRGGIEIVGMVALAVIMICAVLIYIMGGSVNIHITLP
jgi:hypothetical protein